MESLPIRENIAIPNPNNAAVAIPTKALLDEPTNSVTATKDTKILPPQNIPVKYNKLTSFY